jgi:hypothetical protein
MGALFFSAMIDAPAALRELSLCPLHAVLRGARNRRLCVAEGLTVELLPSPGVGLAEQALLDGTAEVIWAGPMRVMKHHDDHPDSSLVCFARSSAVTRSRSSA